MWTQPPYNYKNPFTIIKTFWFSPPTTADGLSRISIFPHSAGCTLSAIFSALEQLCLVQRLVNNAGILVGCKMYIRVSRHQSHWGHSGLVLLLMVVCHRIHKKLKWGVGWAVDHYHLKKHAPKQIAVNRAVVDKVTGLLFYMTSKEF